MTSFDGDNNSLNDSINPVTSSRIKLRIKTSIPSFDKLRNDLVLKPQPRQIPYNQMESIKGMTKTMSIHRQKKWERRPERQRMNVEMSLPLSLQNRLCTRQKKATEKNVDSSHSLSDDNNQHLASSIPNKDVKVPARVCKSFKRENIVIHQELVDNVQFTTHSNATTDGLKYNHVDNSNSVTKYNALTTSSNEQTKIFLKTDIIDKNKVSEQTIKSEKPCSYMPQMQPRSNDPHMLTMRCLPEKPNQQQLLPSSSSVMFDNKEHASLLSSSPDGNIDIEDKDTINNEMQQLRNVSTVNEHGYVGEILNRLCLQPISLPSLPSLFRNENAACTNNDTSFQEDRLSSTLRHTFFENIFRKWSPSKLASTELSATSKSYLMILVLLFISNMAGACSSRSTPKPRPPTHSAMRPNITFQTYACPKAYAEWYCLNGATCFTVKIADSILYNCECADGYMGQRCEFKDLEGSYLPARERFLMGAGSISGNGVLGQLGSNFGINSSNIGNAFIGVLIVIVLAIIVSAVYTQNRTKSKLTRAKLSSQNSSSLSSIPTQSISALADGLEQQNTSWSGSLPMTGHHISSQQRSYSLSPSDMNRSALSRGLWIRSNGNKDKRGRNRSPFFWRSSSESSGRTTKMGSKECPDELPSEVLSHKSRHLSTISYSLSHHSESAPSTPSSKPMEYSPTSTVDIQSSCYPNIEDQYYINSGLSRHVPYSQRGRRYNLPNTENIELKVSRIHKESLSLQNNDYQQHDTIEFEPAQNSHQEPSIFYDGEAYNPTTNVRSLQGQVEYRTGHISI